jgi:osmotically-inducible protein OsmY
MINTIFIKLFQFIVVGVLLALSVNGCTSTPTQASTGQIIDDSAITAKVKAKLLDDPTVSGLAISVETYKGIVQLSGFANSQSEIRQADNLARHTEGVRSIRNNIQLKR